MYIRIYILAHVISVCVCVYAFRQEYVVRMAVCVAVCMCVYVVECLCGWMYACVYVYVCVCEAHSGDQQTFSRCPHA